MQPTMPLTLNSRQTDMYFETDTTYNGWANYETWNAALWIGNTRAYYDTAFGCSDYAQFVDAVETPCTGDGVRWDNPLIDREEMDEMIDELHD
jgi:hypothetical protein